MAATARRLAALPARPKIIAPYERVSALMGREDEAFRSPDIQRRANLETIARAGAVPFAEAVEHPERFRDIDRTGRDFHREGIQRLLRLKREGVIDGIAVLDVSRVGRSTSETLEVIDVFRDGEHGLFLSAREQIDDSPQGEWMLTNLVAMAQLQSDNIAAGWRTVIEVRHESGLHNGTPPVGYRHARDERGELTTPRAIELDPSTARYVHEAFERYAGGHSPTSIQRWLAGLGVLRKSTIKDMLANPFYAGDVRLFAYTGRAKRRAKIKGVPPFVKPGRHEALVERELFERVQQRLMREQRTAKRHLTPVHALGGLAKCEHCDRARVHQRYAPSHPQAGTNYLRDVNGRAKGCVGVGAAKVEEIEALVRTEVARVLTFDVDDAASAELVQQRRAALAQRDELVKAIERTESALGDVDADFYSGILPRERHERVAARLDAELARLRGALAELPETLATSPSAPQLVEAARRLHELWDAASPGERNVLLRECGVVAVHVSSPRGYRDTLEGRVRVTIAV
jgi:site-specific DNA recombinase